MTRRWWTIGKHESDIGIEHSIRVTAENIAALLATDPAWILLTRERSYQGCSASQVSTGW